MIEFTHEFSATFSAPPARVFAALTDAGALRVWFAERAEVDAQPGGAYRFWGRHSLGTPTEDRATQQIRRVEAPQLLEYSWRVEGHDSEVSIGLEHGQQGGTVLRGKHHFPDPMHVERFPELIDDLWRLMLGNLAAYLQTGRAVMLPDFLDPAPKLQRSIVIEAPPARVFRALVEPQTLNEWIASDARVELREGGAYSYGWKHMTGDREVCGGPTHIVQMDQDRRLVVDWPDWRGDTAVPPTSVTWTLDPQGSSTRVAMTHGVFQRAADFSDYPFGWTEFLERLKSVVEARS